MYNYRERRHIEIVNNRAHLTSRHTAAVLCILRSKFDLEVLSILIKVPPNQ